MWESVPCLVNGTSATVKNLQEGKNYKFRVTAANMFGVSEPLESALITAKNPFGKKWFHFS